MLVNIPVSIWFAVESITNPFVAPAHHILNICACILTIVFAIIIVVILIVVIFMDWFIPVLIEKVNSRKIRIFIFYLLYQIKRKTKTVYILEAPYKVAWVEFNYHIERTALVLAELEFIF